MKMLSLIAAAAVTALTTAQAGAAVSTCQALSLYANAANTGLCKSVSPTTQNLWVCELAQSPDVHLTFNAGTNLHVTVRKLSPACEGLAQFNGAFPGGLTLAQPHTICGVNVADYVPRLNAVPQLAAAPNQTLVKTAILAAKNRGRVTDAVAQTYIATATHQGCP
jgi:hypothetical protein